jgi:ribonucleotide monophosphatase NagD (HAD superfamily)
VQQSIKFSQEEWEDWQGSLITQAVQGAVLQLLERQEQSAQQAYWAGKPWPDSSREALVRLRAWHEDFFTASYDEIKTALERE